MNKTYASLVREIESMDMIFTDDIVTYQGVLYKVVKVNPANYRCIDNAGKSWNLRRTPHVKKATLEQAATFSATLPDIEVGMVVTTDSPRFPGLWVVINVNGGRGKMARLGGGLGFTGPLGGLKPVDEINNHGKS